MQLAAALKHSWIFEISVCWGPAACSSGMVAEALRSSRKPTDLEACRMVYAGKAANQQAQSLAVCCSVTLCSSAAALLAIVCTARSTVHRLSPRYPSVSAAAAAPPRRCRGAVLLRRRLRLQTANAPLIASFELSWTVDGAVRLPLIQPQVATQRVAGHPQLRHNPPCLLQPRSSNWRIIGTDYGVCIAPSRPIKSRDPWPGPLKQRQSRHPPLTALP